MFFFTHAFTDSITTCLFVHFWLCIIDSIVFDQFNQSGQITEDLRVQCKSKSTGYAFEFETVDIIAFIGKIHFVVFHCHFGHDWKLLFVFDRIPPIRTDPVLYRSLRQFVVSLSAVCFC